MNGCKIESPYRTEKWINPSGELMEAVYVNKDTAPLHCKSSDLTDFLEEIRQHIEKLQDANKLPVQQP